MFKNWNRDVNAQICVTTVYYCHNTHGPVNNFIGNW